MLLANCCLLKFLEDEWKLRLLTSDDVVNTDNLADISTLFISFRLAMLTSIKNIRLLISRGM